jgi:hypothetical protein
VAEAVAEEAVAGRLDVGLKSGFVSFGYNGLWWSSTEDNSSSDWSRYLNSKIAMFTEAAAIRRMGCLFVASGINLFDNLIIC